MNKKIAKPSPLDSIREAVLTVSPKRQYLGILSPTTPATAGPDMKKEWLNRDECFGVCT